MDIKYTRSDRIEKVSFFKATSPESRPISDSTHQIDEISFIVTRIELSGGVIGESYLLSFDYSPNGIRGVLEDVADFARGFHIDETGRFITEFERQCEYFGDIGLNRWAIGAINIAMWDARGKLFKQPVQALLGTYHQKIPLYGSGGWLSYSLDELLEEVTGYVKRGFKAVKIKVGSSELQRDVERLAKARETAGDNIRLMIDANQGLTVDSASDLINMVKHLGISWFEEPISNTDYDGYRTLSSRFGISLAMGEREFDLTALRELLNRNAIDLWQPDILRMGSVEAWRESAAIANANHLNVLPHFYKEYDVPLLTTVKGIHAAESFDWVDPLVDEPLRMDNGWAYPNDRPGWGFSFRDSVLTPLS